MKVHLDDVVLVEVVLQNDISALINHLYVHVLVITLIDHTYMHALMSIHSLTHEKTYNHTYTDIHSHMDRHTYTYGQT